ncbi:MAG: hypothetical protein NTV88_00600 [Candidatus Micrarchaeota archaeon]|nr:hypothetical protein [Candidatus Micrarchaeota archaeon]
MHKENKNKRTRAFFSIDASFAIVVVVLSFAMFSLLSSSAASFAAEGAKDVSKTNIALRLSSYILNDAAVKSGGDPPDNYVFPGEIDENKIQPAFMQPMLSDAVSQGKFHFAKVSVKRGAAAIPIASSVFPAEK